MKITLVDMKPKTVAILTPTYVKPINVGHMLDPDAIVIDAGNHASLTKVTLTLYPSQLTIRRATPLERLVYRIRTKLPPRFHP